MRTMVDSTNIADEPSADLVLYYCDGEFAVSEAAVRARFPNAIPVPCSAIGTNSGVVGDCEPGCMTEDQLVDWVLVRRAANIDPTGYVNEMHGWVPAKAAFARRGVREPHWGVADYDAIDVIPPGAVFKQDKNSAMTGGHFDRSVVVDFWPGVDSVFGPSVGSGGLDMAIADDILAAVTMPPPAKPARFAGQTDQQLIETIVKLSPWADIDRVYTPVEAAYLYAISHPVGLAQAVGTLQAAVAALQNHVGSPVDNSSVLVAIAAVKAEEDAIKAQVTSIEGNLNAPRPPA